LATRGGARARVSERGGGMSGEAGLTAGHSGSPFGLPTNSLEMGGERKREGGSTKGGKGRGELRDVEVLNLLMCQLKKKLGFGGGTIRSKKLGGRLWWKRGAKTHCGGNPPGSENSHFKKTKRVTNEEKIFLDKGGRTPTRGLYN